MMRLRTKSADDTRALGAELARLLRPGDVVLLAGDLGAGKTSLVQGLGRGLGVDEPITSPTFTLVRCYDCEPVLLHADVYRLDHLQEAIDLGLPELLDDGAVAVIEWGDVLAPTLPADFLELRLELTDTDDERAVHVRTVGPTWAPRGKALEAALGRWSVVG
jgi:tRNA threonylcarbamoyladenosine biosynthesis protein TsaE